MPRAPLRLPTWALAALPALACASAPPLPPGVSAVPVRGDSLEQLLAKLQHAEEPAPRVELRELQVSAVDREPWQRLGPEAAPNYPGRVAVIAGRRCNWREGFERASADSGSWYLLERDAVVAFDHQGFGARCGSRPAFEFLPAGEAALERNLMRYLSQRYPPGELPGDVRLARGLQLLALGRREDAEYELYALDRRLRELRLRQSETETPDPDERARLAREEEELRPLRAQLARALREEDTEEALLP